MERLHPTNAATPRAGAREPQRALVIGGSMAGLLAARVLAERFAEVLIVDRDEALPATPSARRGAPQGRHVHALLPRGARILRELCPGIIEAMHAAGAERADMLRDAQWCFGEHRLARAPSELEVVACSRPLLEGVLRREVLALPNVRVETGVRVSNLRAAEDRTRVIGATVSSRTGEERAIDAALVVDAAGRASQLGAWLEQLGYVAPREQRLQVRVGYASARFRVPEHVREGRKALIVGGSAATPRGGVAQVIEDDLVEVSISAFHRAPPTDLQGFIEYTRTFLHPDIHEWLAQGELASSIASHRVAHTYRRHFERLGRFPEGVVAIGDALCAFNPIYAQGMTVAALEACELRSWLVEDGAQRPLRYFARASRALAPAWQMAASNDLQIPDVAGSLPWPARVINRWIGRVQAAGVHDPEIAAAFLRVVALIDPPARLLAPGFVWKVSRASTAAARGARSRTLPERARDARVA
jgi:2-polyprenyl-6-methoxyphenol hydroxylase-like FAD-dependent oxidoreductase